MERIDVIWRLMSGYVLILLFMLLCSGAFGQVQVSYFNADWNKANGVKWIDKLDDVNTFSYIDIAQQSTLATKHKIAVIPTIIIFKDNEEVARFQADLSFKMIATKEDVQRAVDSLINQSGDDHHVFIEGFDLTEDGYWEVCLGS